MGWRGVAEQESAFLKLINELILFRPVVGSQQVQAESTEFTDTLSLHTLTTSPTVNIPTTVVHLLQINDPTFGTSISPRVHSSL